MTDRKRVFRGDRLKEARTKRGLTQEELADRVGFGQSQLTKYENGRSEPSPEIIVRLVRALEVTADWLLGLVDDPDMRIEEEELSPIERKLLLVFRRGNLRDLMKISSQETEPEH